MPEDGWAHKSSTVLCQNCNQFVEDRIECSYCQIWCCQYCKKDHIQKHMREPILSENRDKAIRDGIKEIAAGAARFVTCWKKDGTYFIAIITAADTDMCENMKVVINTGAIRHGKLGRLSRYNQKKQRWLVKMWGSQEHAYVSVHHLIPYKVQQYEYDTFDEFRRKYLRWKYVGKKRGCFVCGFKKEGKRLKICKKCDGHDCKKCNGKFEQIKYCSKYCQKRDWKNHRNFDVGSL